MRVGASSLPTVFDVITQLHVTRAEILAVHATLFPSAASGEYQVALSMDDQIDLAARYADEVRHVRASKLASMAQAASADVVVADDNNNALAQAFVNARDAMRVTDEDKEEDDASQSKQQMEENEEAAHDSPHYREEKEKREAVLVRSR